MKGQIEWLPLESLIPYDRNARIIVDIEPLKASIREFGFQNPIIIDKHRVIICGHTRLRAAQELGLTKLPCLVADELTDAQVKAFRLADNRANDFTKWDQPLLFGELEDMGELTDACDMSDFGFDTSEMAKRRAAWARLERRCDLKKRLKQHFHGGMVYSTIFEVGKNGLPLEQIKADPANVPLFSDCLADYVMQAFGANLSAGNWAMVTAPRRRHKDGFHFATSVCSEMSKALGIPFYKDAFSARDRGRLEPTFEMNIDPAEKNIFFVDDIVTTASTARACRDLLISAGKVCLLIIGIKN